MEIIKKLKQKIENNTRAYYKLKAENMALEQKIDELETQLERYSRNAQDMILKLDVTLSKTNNEIKDEKNDDILYQ